ncbi:MAG: hypothetical protein LLG00_02850 [Planctomycetaceae bacterium]|nr:hypothetical protein [Planctomycetaceae bacterium]
MNTMWCKDCRQDVPALPSADSQTLCCPRCGEELRAGTMPPQPAVVAGPEACAAAECDTSSGGFGLRDPMPFLDDWEVGEQLRDIERALWSPKPKEPQPAKAGPQPAVRVDAAHAAVPPMHTPQIEQPGRPRQEKEDNVARVLVVVTWVALGLGAMGFLSGGLLLCGSLLADRPGLWTLGLSVAIIGQVALLVGLVLQLDRLWRNNREAAAKLQDVDEQLHDLKSATTLLGTAQGPAATTFYSHFAGGASPQLLLTDLKSQIDLLAMKIAQVEQ